MQLVCEERISLLALLVKSCPDSSKNTIKGWIDQGRILIGDTPADRGDQMLEKGQVVSFTRCKKFASMGVTILYEDHHLVVVNKPEGLLSVSVETKGSPSLHQILKRRSRAKVVYPIHRLDKATSGLLVFAYTEQARDGLKQQLQERTMSREYKAITCNNPGKGTWRHYLQEAKDLTVYVSPEGKEAVTHFDTVQWRHPYALVHFSLQTGRKHQIRVQAAESGYPILGDEKYGSGKAKRLYLHAEKLTFIHPILGKKMSFFSKAPF